MSNPEASMVDAASWPSALPLNHDRDWGCDVAAPPASQAAAQATVRVLHVINGEHYSGAERVQDLLAARLPEFGYSAGFACVKPGRFAAARQCREAPIHETPMRSKWDLRAAWRIAGIAREEGYAAIHAHTPRSGVVARVAASICRLPLVYHVHSPASRDSTHAWRNRAHQWAEWYSLARVSAIVAVSASLRRHLLAQGYCPDRVFTVPNGVPIAANCTARVRPTGPWTLGMAALFRPRKGLEVLLQALAILHRNNIPVRLRAVGPFETPAYEREIHDQAERLGIARDVTWTGFTRDIPGELARMDLFVLPSLFGEGLPMVVLEAMAAGVPVVATRVEGIPEAIEHGVSGMLAAPRDPDDLASRIGEVVRGDMDWQSLRRGAFARQAAEFSDVRMASRMAEVYRLVLGAPRQP